MNKLKQEAPQSFRGRLFQTDSARPKEQRILVLKTGIAGTKFHIKSEEERDALNTIEPGTELLLIREPENKYDEWAIAVHLTKEDKLGFITRFKNETIARLMDVGKKFIAITDDPNELWKDQLDERHRDAPTENNDLPISIYLVEE